MPLPLSPHLHPHISTPLPLTPLRPLSPPCSQMVDHATFERCFWEVLTRLQDSATAQVGVPGYFRFLTLLGGAGGGAWARGGGASGGARLLTFFQIRFCF